MLLTGLSSKLRITTLLFGSWLLLITCSEVGRQTPELWSARFTEDGSRLVYTYDVYTVWQYEKKGGAVRRSGTRKGYMNVRDAATGRSLLTEPYQSKNTLNIVALDGDFCALSGFNIKKSRQELSIVDITTGKERFGSEELSRLNGGLQFDPLTQYENITGRPGFVFAAEDARAYLLDPSTGKAGLVDPGKRVASISGGRNPDGMGPPSARMSFVGQPRKALKMHGQGSSMDFIDPHFASGPRSGQGEREPVTFNDNPIVISRTSTAQDFSWLISMLDAQSLELIWSASVVNVSGAAPFFNADPLFHLNEKELLVQTSTQLSQLDVATGNINWTVQVP